MTLGTGFPATWGGAAQISVAGTAAGMTQPKSDPKSDLAEHLRRQAEHEREFHVRELINDASGRLPHTATRAAVVEEIVKLPYRIVMARRFGRQSWEIFIDNPPEPERISASERKRIHKDSIRLLKNFGTANGATDRKTADQYGLKLVWRDWGRRRKQSVLSEEENWQFRILPWENCRTRMCFIEDLRAVLFRYCERYWEAPMSKRISTPGRKKSLQQVNGTKIRELRTGLELTQRGLANACNPAVSIHRIIRAEQGKATEALIQNLADTFRRLRKPI